MTNVLAIDFGTSNSAAAIWRNGAPEVLTLDGDAVTLPTAVFFDFDAQEMLIGERANAALLEGYEGRFMRGLKSLLGTGLMRESLMLLGERLDFIDIIARFLADVKQRSEAVSGLTFERALSGRPVVFHSDDPKRNAQALIDLTEAYQRAGFTAVEFMNEPDAAALASADQLQNGGLAVIIDIGGGTSDFTVFKPKGKGIDILASHGLRLGGTDFDKHISIAKVMPQLGMGSPVRHAFGNDTHLAPNAIFNELATWQKIPFLYTAETRRKAEELAKYAVHAKRMDRLVKVLEDELGHDIAFAVEAGKICANDPSVEDPRIRMDMLRKGASLALSADVMEQVLTPFADQIAGEAVTAAEMAGIDVADVTDVIFVGGTSLMGVVERGVSQRFAKASVHRGSALTAIIDGLAIASRDV